jgi:hypothetical protein
VVATDAAPFVFCGFAAHATDAGSRIAGGLIYLKSLGEAGLASLSKQLKLQRSRMDALDHAVQGAMQRIVAMSNVTDSIERRTDPRVLLDGFVELHTATGAVQAEVFDLSEGGLRCTVDGSIQLTVGMSLEVQLTFGSPRRPSPQCWSVSTWPTANATSASSSAPPPRPRSR